jgi:hypothetical protein
LWEIHCVRPNGTWIRREVRHRCLTGGGAVRLASELGGAESHSPVPRIVHQSGRHNCIVVDIAGSFQDGSIIDLTFIGTFRVPGSDEEE